MTIGLSYDDTLSRVQIALSGLPNGAVRVERSTNELLWETVRGGVALPIVGGAGNLSDYEFAADVENHYRVRQTRWESLVEIFTSSGTWTKPDGLVAVKVTVVGGGGAGGGSESTNADEASAGTGGQAGATAVSWIDADDLGSSETVTVGSGGSGVSGDEGGSGGTSSITRTTGTDVSAGGGDGGALFAATPQALRIVASQASSLSGDGDLVLPGEAGEGAMASGTEEIGYGGRGGSSALAGGGRGSPSASNGDGNDGDGPGAGGGGSVTSGSSGPARAGGAGGGGIVIVEHFFDEV